MHPSCLLQSKSHFRGSACAGVLEGGASVVNLPRERAPALVVHVDSCALVRLAARRGVHRSVSEASALK
eukprot:11363913-Alexandrium_andersonii.AAC.1